ncbi:MAG: hypothetical protein U1F09_16760 [Steroidobacteraceae bacterium]
MATIDAARSMKAVASVVDAGLLDRALEDAPRVDQQVVRHDGQRPRCAPHREQVRLVDVDRVDLVDLDHAPIPMPSAEHGSARRAPRASPSGTFLESVTPMIETSTRENDGSGDDGSGERAHADLVHAGDEREARAPERALGEQLALALALPLARELAATRPVMAARIHPTSPGFQPARTP